MNKEFEQLPEVAKRLDGIYWNAELNIYQTKYPILFNAVGFVNGALYVYQEQQEKIDAVLKIIDEKCNKFCESHDMDSVALLEGIEELLK